MNFKLFKQMLLGVLLTLTLQAQVDVKEIPLISTAGQKVAMTGGHAIVAGQTTGNAATGEVHFFNLDYSNFTWGGQTPALTVEGNITSVDIDGDFAVVGTTFYGQNAEYIYAFNGNGNKFIRYNTATNIWANVPVTNPQSIGEGGAMVIVANDMFALKGDDTTQFMTLDTSTLTWVAKAPIPEQVRAGGALVQLGAGGNYLYATRGIEKQRIIIVNHEVFTKEFYQFDMINNSWTRKADLLGDGSGDGCAMASDGQYIYLIEGEGDSGFLNWAHTKSKKFRRFDPLNGPNGTWTTLADLPGGILTGGVGTGGAMTYKEGKIYVLEGDGSDNLHIYDISAPSSGWTTVTTPQSIGDGGSMTFDGKDIFVFAGDNKKYFWKLNTSDNSWEVTPPAESPNNVNLGAALASHRKSDSTYVYKRDTTSGVWSEGIRYTVANPAPNDKFGEAVAIRDAGNAQAQVLIGLPGRPTNGGVGTVLNEIFDPANLPPTPALTIPNTGGDPSYKSFGSQIEIKDGVIIVADNDVPNKASTLRIFGGVGGNYTQTVSIATSIAIDGNLSAVGGPAANLLYKHDGSSWSLELGSSEQAVFGSVALDQRVFLSTNSIEPLYNVHFNPLRSDATPVANGSTILTTVGGTSATGTDSDLHKDHGIINDPDNTQAIIFDVPCGLRPTELVANEWAMVSVPCGNEVATFNELFGNDMLDALGHLAEYGESDTANWVIYEDGPNYTGKSNDNVLVDVNTPMKLGQGYWIISDTNVTFKADFNAITTRTPLTFIHYTSPAVRDSWFYKVLLPVQTTSSPAKKVMLGNPFPREIHWGNAVLDVDNSAGYIDSTAYVYDTTSTSGQPYRAIPFGTPGFQDIIKPYQGFWVKVNEVTSAPTNLPGIRLDFEK